MYFHMPMICLSKSNGVKLRRGKDHFGCIPGKNPIAIDYSNTIASQEESWWKYPSFRSHKTRLGNEIEICCKK